MLAGATLHLYNIFAGSTSYLRKLHISMLWRAGYAPADRQTSWGVLPPYWPSTQLGVYSTTLVQSLYISCYLSDNKPVLSYLFSRLLPQCDTSSLRIHFCLCTILNSLRTGRCFQLLHRTLHSLIAEYWRAGATLYPGPILTGASSLRPRCILAGATQDPRMLTGAKPYPRSTGARPRHIVAIY